MATPPSSRRPASALVVALLLAACGTTGDPDGSAAPTTTTPVAGGTKECVAPQRGYRVEFPSTWFVNDAEHMEPCRFFHPEPFSLQPGTEATGVAVTVQLNPLSFDRATPAAEGSFASEVLDRRTATVDGRPAVRVETRSTGAALLPAEVRGVSWFVDVAPGTLVATTTEATPAGTFGGNVEVLDEMMRSLRILPRRSACSAGRSAPAPAPQPALPAAVAAMRAQIVAAASDCDYEALARLALAGNGFTYSFGEQGQPAAYWRAAESGGRMVMRSLVEILDTPFATRTVEGTTHYVWPSSYASEHWDDVPAADREALGRLYGEDELRRFEQFGSYIGDRVGITENGDWIFFVAGD